MREAPRLFSQELPGGTLPVSSSVPELTAFGPGVNADKEGGLWLTGSWELPRPSPIPLSACAF